MRGKIVQPGSANITAQQKYSTTGHQRFVPLRMFEGKNPIDRGPVTREVWCDMHRGKIVGMGGKDWEQGPPELPSGDPGKELRCQSPSQSYRANYGAIFGHE